MEPDLTITREKPKQPKKRNAIPGILDIIELTVVLPFDEGLMPSVPCIYRDKCKMWEKLNNAKTPVTFEKFKAVMQELDSGDKNQVWKPLVDLCLAAGHSSIDLELPRYPQHAAAIFQQDFKATLLMKETGMVPRSSLTILDLLRLLEHTTCPPLRAEPGTSPETYYVRIPLQRLITHLALNDVGEFSTYQFQIVPYVWTNAFVETTLPAILRGVSLGCSLDNMPRLLGIERDKDMVISRNDAWVWFFAARAGTSFSSSPGGQATYIYVATGWVSIFWADTNDKAAACLLHQLGPYNAPPGSFRVTLRQHDAM